MDDLAKLISKHQSQGLKVGLVCGCFDILHIGHIRLFQYAKEKIDKLVVGADDDYSIKRTKGENRPIHTQAVRLEMLACLELVDHVFPIDFHCKFGNKYTKEKFKELLIKLHPDNLFTCVLADKFASSKEALCKKLNIQFSPFCNKFDTSTTTIEKVYLESY